MQVAPASTVFSKGSWPANRTLPRSHSLPSQLDIYVAPPAPARVAFAQVLQGFDDLLAEASRPLTPEDRRAARRDPVCRGKKVQDAASLGFKPLQRRAQRLRREGQQGLARATDVVACIAVTPTVLDCIPNIVVGGGRWIVQRAVGAPYFKERTEGGVREDVVLHCLHAYQHRLSAKFDWAFADRAEGADPSPDDVHRLMHAAARTDAALRQYVLDHPDPRVRDSEALQAAFRSVRSALVLFHADLAAIAAKTVRLPTPPAVERVQPPALTKRHWSSVDSALCCVASG